MEKNILAKVDVLFTQATNRDYGAQTVNNIQVL